ncbi:MAG TPA: antibiotic biosynthesis monooxygenase [Gemmatimonadaceae bacterium]
MYSVVRRYTVKPGGARELAERVEREFVPILKSVPGFVSYTYLEGGQEWGRDVLATVSVFTDREGAEESVRRAAKWVGDNLGPYEPSQPSVTAGEVLFTTHEQPSVVH